MGIFSDVATGVVNSGVNLFNAYQSYRQNQINNQYARRNARLQEDVAYNGLGIRVADAERNGISKWSVVGDGATAGQISNNTEPSHADKLDAIMDSISMKQMRLTTEKLAEEKENLKYQRDYAVKHALPIGIQPGLEQSLLGWLDTPDNRKIIENLVGSILGQGKSVLDKIEQFEPPKIDMEKMKKDVKKEIPFTNEWERDRYEHKERNGGEKAAKEQARKDRSGDKARKRKLRAQNRNSGALPPGSIPDSIYRRKY